MTIGERIKIKRNEMKMSQRELAKRIGYADHSTITKIESGKVDLPQSKIVMFAEVLNTTVPYLMGWEEVQKNNDTITDAVVKMRTDEEFFSIVECLMSLDADKLSIIKQTALAFKK